VILTCNYEELNALKEGARQILDVPEPAGAAVAAPAEERALVAELLPRLVGDLSVLTLAEFETLIRSVTPIVERLRIEMQSAVAATHPASEGAVAAYFEFAHAYAVLAKLEDMDSEMRAMIEVVNGRPVTVEDERGFVFPD
jgi:hypothetical protein